MRLPARHELMGFDCLRLGRLEFLCLGSMDPVERSEGGRSKSMGWMG